VTFVSVLFVLFAVVWSDRDQTEQFKVSLCLVSVIFESDLMTFSFFTVFVSVVVRYWTVVFIYAYSALFAIILFCA